MFSGISYDYVGAQVLVTGGSNGIGLACARAYREAGAEVVITGRRPSAGDYEHDLSGFTYIELDVSDRAALLALPEKLQRLDILVNNAGGTQADEWSHEGFDHSLDINLSSAFHLSTACRPLLEASEFAGGASIIGIASMTSYFGSEWTPAYGPAKAGIVQMTKTFGHCWGKYGIRANAVAAGLTRTNLVAPVIDHMPDMIEETFARQGIKRVGEAEDIAAAVLFLTSPAASWITGQTLPVDGGFTVGM
ncbi:SDR family NAD(P)-dependent oxidoreductase [Litorivivens sp.]|uniref:SDR family NAD(P)-dependent oxidoreductase n=1 Tax=Litorivivens sp. TaxID=2020868 RepID=UPI003562DA4A